MAYNVYATGAGLPAPVQLGHGHDGQPRRFFIIFSPLHRGQTGIIGLLVGEADCCGGYPISFKAAIALARVSPLAAGDTHCAFHPLRIRHAKIFIPRRLYKMVPPQLQPTSAKCTPLYFVTRRRPVRTQMLAMGLTADNTQWRTFAVG
jgi:hypothetical protein